MKNRPAYAKAYREKNRDAIKAYANRWRQANRERVRVYNRRAREKRPDYLYAWRWRLQGFTLAERDALIAAQGGLCALCARTLGARPHTDHDHATGQIRGIICSNCNRGLGYLGDSVESLTAAIAYLQRSKSAARKAAGA